MDQRARCSNSQRGTDRISKGIPFSSHGPAMPLAAAAPNIRLSRKNLATMLRILGGDSSLARAFFPRHGLSHPSSIPEISTAPATRPICVDCLGMRLGDAQDS